MLKEARIILPQNPYVRARVTLRRKAAEWWGGFTVTTGKGVWHNPDNDILEDEVVEIYDIAMEDSEANQRLLLNLAMDIGVMARQHTMYVRLPSGQVQMLETIHGWSSISA